MSDKTDVSVPLRRIPGEGAGGIRPRHTIVFICLLTTATSDLQVRIFPIRPFLSYMGLAGLPLHITRWGEWIRPLTAQGEGIRPFTPIVQSYND